MTASPIPDHHDIDSARVELPQELVDAIEARTQLPVIDALEGIVRLLSVTAPAAADLTTSQIEALQSVGSYVNTPPTPLNSPRMRTALRGEAILRDALTAREVGELLGVTAARVRQRAQLGSLLGWTSGGEWRFPRIQFTATGELPSWSTVATAFPAGVHPVELEGALTTPSVDLVLDGITLSPRDWLLSSGDPAAAITTIRGAFTIL